LPQLKLLECFNALTSLDLSHNRLSTFDPTPITKGLPNLVKINFEFNEIETLNDLVKLGQMPHIQEINVLNNSLVETHKWHQILGELLFPSDTTKPDPVKLYTATYTHVPNFMLPPKVPEIDMRGFIWDEDETIRNLTECGMDHHSAYMRMMRSRDPENEKYVSFVAKDCPMRKVGQFRNLMTLNGRRITIFDIFQVSEYNNYHDIVINELEEKTKEKHSKIAHKMDKGKKVEKLVKPDKKLQQYYVNNYEKKLRKKLEEYEPILN
jgi:hypothetical protein